MVERRWRTACKTENDRCNSDDLTSSVSPVLPNDSELATAFVERKKREGSARGFGIRVIQSSEGSDSWVDDPITRHIIGLHVKKEEGSSIFIWPLILNIKSHYSILVLPLVEPQHIKHYASLCRRSDCGSAIGAESSLSSLLLDLPSITG